MFFIFISSSFFHSRLRTATLHHDENGQAVLINLLLWNYLHYNLYDQADKLVSKSSFPQNASNNEWARHLFYLGTDFFSNGIITSVEIYTSIVAF